MNNRNHLQSLGVIGGMGPEATFYFYQGVIEHTNAKEDQDHLDMVILNHASMPDRTSAILSHHEEEVVDALISDAKKLEQLGVAHIAIPCNTSYYFYKQITAAINIPVINMIDETVQFIADSHKAVHKIGILATTGTIQTGIYHNACKKLGITPVSPSSKGQDAIMSLIYDDIKQGHIGSIDSFFTAYDDLKDCDYVILGCTELSVFKDQTLLPRNCIDAMDILIRRSIEYSGAQYI